MISVPTLFIAAAVGILPALFWLWFWLREDTMHHEPRGVIFCAFLAGMFVAPLAIPFQGMVAAHFGDKTPQTLVLWAAIEEILKFTAAFCVALRSRKIFDEPIDALMYLITVALGFAAMENTLFLLGAFHNGSFIDGLILGNIRFVGASLLHTVCSALIGTFLAISFYLSRTRRLLYAAAGLVFAVVLHMLFNFFILKGNHALFVFSVVWLAVISLLLVFEKVKHINHQQ